ncbi:MAG: universal stress protein [Thaumarchaeota archaeon]|nr:universal stress protein [Nitrososphaerota archaeon]MDE1840885.1 universal stress protein [Nitrososphaerota archaeon]MDE1877470.1 universal stress protein [Nitrososphaerota archaeon]
MAKYQVRKILVPMDGSKNSFRGLDTAIYLARQCGATLTGLFVMPIYPQSFMPITYDKKYLTKAAKEFMDNAKKRSAQNGIVFVGKTTIGKESSEIIDCAARNKFDIIVIGARGIGSVKEAFLGSVSHAVVHKSKIPVLVVK